MIQINELQGPAKPLTELLTLPFSLASLAALATAVLIFTTTMVAAMIVAVVLRVVQGMRFKIRAQPHGQARLDVATEPVANQAIDVVIAHAVIHEPVAIQIGSSQTHS